MTRGIGKRLRDLENATAGQACGECGDGGGDPASWEVIWGDPEEPAGPEQCGTCGRPLEIVLTWADHLPGGPKGAA